MRTTTTFKSHIIYTRACVFCFTAVNFQISLTVDVFKPSLLKPRIVAKLRLAAEQMDARPRGEKRRLPILDNDLDRFSAGACS